MNRKYLASWWFPIGLCLFSCGHTGHPLDDRVAAFWTALVERDRVTAQQFVAPASSPDYARDLNSSEMWAQKKGRSSLI